MHTVRIWLLTIACVVLCGCGSTEPETTADGPPLERAAAPADGGQRAVPQDAARAVLAVVDGFKENRPEAIWEFLPAGHQREINELAREFAVRMDAELWRQTAAVARASADLLKSRKGQILSHPALRDVPLAADGTLAARWDGFVALLSSVSGGELADLHKMKSFDGQQFFARFDAASLEQLHELSILLGEDNPFSLLREMIAGAEVTLLEAKGDRATVRIRPQQGEPRDFDFTRVEGKWFPTAWASGLREDVRRARSRLDTELDPQVLAQKKKLVMPWLADAQGILDELRQAKTDESFHAVMTERIIKPAMIVQSGEATAAATPVDLAENAGDAVTIVVPRELRPAAIEAIADALLSGGADRELTDSAADGATTFVVSPVKDVAAFAESIRFGKVTRVDAAKRTITVEVPEESP